MANKKYDSRNLLAIDVILKEAKLKEDRVIMAVAYLDLTYEVFRMS